jgi:outer membrane protein
MKKIIIYISIAYVFFCGNLFAQKSFSLEECKQLALRNNSKSKNSNLEIEAAIQTKKSAFTNYFPSISAGALTFKAEKGLMELGFGGASISLLEKGTFGYLNVVQPLFTGGRIINGNSLAGLGVEVKELQGKLAGKEIVLKAEEQYWLIVSLEEKYKTICKYEEMLNSILQQVEEAFNSGLIMKNDVLKVKLKKSELLLNKSKLENGKKLASLAFCQFLGIPYETGISFCDSAEITDPPESNWTDNSPALKNRSEYGLLQKSVEAEKLQTRMKLGEFLPQVAVGISGLYMKMDEGNSRTLGMIFGTVSIPISGWWGGSHELQERSIKENIAENNFKDTSELLILQMQKAWHDLSDSYKQYLLSVQSKEQADENLKVNNDGYKNGLITISDLLEAQALFQQMQNQLTDAKTNYLIKKTIYLQVTGR